MRLAAVLSMVICFGASLWTLLTPHPPDWIVFVIAGGAVGYGAIKCMQLLTLRSTRIK